MVAVQVVDPVEISDVTTPPVTSPPLQVKTDVLCPSVFPAGQTQAAMAAAEPSSQRITACACILEAAALKLAILALVLALERFTKTMEAKIPIIAITIKSSIRVKAFILAVGKTNAFIIAVDVFIFLFRID